MAFLCHNFLFLILNIFRLKHNFNAQRFYEIHTMDNSLRTKGGVIYEYSLENLQDTEVKVENPEGRFFKA